MALPPILTLARTDKYERPTTGIHVRNRHEVHRVLNTTSALPLLASPEQLHYDKGEERLMLTVLKDAIESIERYRYEYGSRCRLTYHEALY